MIDYLAGNGRRIQIIGQLYINNSVQFLGVFDKGGGSGLLFICSLQAPIEVTEWGSGNYSNQDYGGSMLYYNSMTTSAWGDSDNPCLAYLP